MATSLSLCVWLCFVEARGQTHSKCIEHPGTVGVDRGGRGSQNGNAAGVSHTSGGGECRWVTDEWLGRLGPVDDAAVDAAGVPVPSQHAAVRSNTHYPP